MLLEVDGSAPIEVPYDPKLLAFEFEGHEIRNPFLSPCGQFEVDPVETYGFAEAWTGGGCKALELVLPNSDVLLLTDEEGCDIPTISEWRTALIGRRTAGGIPIALCDLGEVPPKNNA